MAKKRLIKQEYLDKMRANLGYEVSDEEFYKVVDNVIDDIEKGIKKGFDEHVFTKEEVIEE